MRGFGHLTFPFRIPKALCNQSVKIILDGTKQDIYGNKEEQAPIIVNNVVFQLETIYSGDNNTRVKTADGVLFIFNSVSNPFPQISVDSTGYIEYEGKKYSISHISINKEPTSSRIWSYEVQVNAYQD